MKPTVYVEAQQLNTVVDWCYCY